MERNPVSEEFFTNDTRLEAVIRESIQNSIDANDATSLVRVRIYFSGLDDALPAADYARYRGAEADARYADLGIGRSSHAHAIVGDYNDPSTIVSALGRYSPGSLTLCFIDPTDCSVPFESIRSIIRATGGKCDLLLSFFDGFDFRRNAAKATLDESYSSLRKKYERFLGTPDFFSRKEIVEAACQGKHADLSQMFRQQYADKLNALGWSYQDWKPIKNYYHLLYASSSSRGLDFWQKATKYDPIGQSEFDFGV